MGYSVKDVVTIASLIEKETDGTDQANIASVIYNRLQNKGETVGLLQIDAALLYGLPNHTGAITNEDKATDTPYNLYLHKGLPPTPIANPGSAALEAAMNPNDTDYYFYYEPGETTTLDYEFLATIKKRVDYYVIYADCCSLSEEKLAQFNITFKKIPRDIAKF